MKGSLKHHGMMLGLALLTVTDRDSGCRILPNSSELFKQQTGCPRLFFKTEVF